MTNRQTNRHLRFYSPYSGLKRILYNIQTSFNSAAQTVSSSFEMTLGVFIMNHSVFECNNIAGINNTLLQYANENLSIRLSFIKRNWKFEVEDFTREKNVIEAPTLDCSWDHCHWKGCCYIHLTTFLTHCDWVWIKSVLVIYIFAVSSWKWSSCFKVDSNYP